MGYPPGWQNIKYENVVQKWEENHPGFPWIKNFSDEEKKNWILGIPHAGPQPGVTWDEYDLARFTNDLDKALRVDKTELFISSIGRIRAVPNPNTIGPLNQRVIIEIQLDDKWIEVWGQNWNGAEFTKQYAMHDIPMNILIESQMIDTSFIERYSWKNTPFSERYKEWLNKAAGTCAWTFMTMAAETKGLVVIGADIVPNIDERGVLVGYYINLHVSDKKAGYIIKQNWGQTIVVGPDGKTIT